MAQIYNTDMAKEIIKGASLQVNRDLVPSQLAEKVVPVMEVNPNMLRICNIIKAVGSSATGDVTIWAATPTTKDFYLCGANLSMCKDATSDGTDAYLSVRLPEETAATVILTLSGITLTAQNQATSININPPMKLKRGSIITMTGSTTLGVFRKSCNIFGYTVENPID